MRHSITGRKFSYQGRVWSVTAKLSSSVELRCGDDCMVRSIAWVEEWMEEVE